MIAGEWKRSFRNGNKNLRETAQKSYIERYDRYIEHIFSKPHTRIRLAVLSDDHDNALGWSVCENTTLHYVFVKWDNRHLGIGMSLLPKNIETITHLTDLGRKLWKMKLPGVQLDIFKE
jgi:hypothetical protein